MVNSVDFVNRLKKVMEIHQLTASNFADKIGVQRSSISHILSGRNKPSLDFILKVTEKFTDVDINWLLKGNGVYPKRKQPSTTLSVPKLIEKNQKNTDTEVSFPSSTIKKIVIFYKDGTFEEFLKK